MKQIGYIDGTRNTWCQPYDARYRPPYSVPLYIVDETLEFGPAADYEPVGYINLESGVHYRGERLVSHVVYETIEQAGPRCTGAYIQTVADLQSLSMDPMNVRRSEFDTLQEAVANLIRERHPAPSHPSVIPLAELLSEVVEFCDTELDNYDGPGYPVEIQRASVYLRELVRILQP